MGVCRIDADGYCEGCLRTLDEIARWPLMDERERAGVFEVLEERREALHSA